MTYAIIKTVWRQGFDETSSVIGYADTFTEADYAIYMLAIKAQYGSIQAGFNAVFSIAEM